MKLNIAHKNNMDDYLRKGDAVYIHGWFRKRIGVCMSNFEVVIQGWFRPRLKKLVKYDKKRYKIYRDGKLIKYVRFKWR